MTKPLSISSSPNAPELPFGAEAEADFIFVRSTCQGSTPK